MKKLLPLLIIAPAFVFGDFVDYKEKYGSMVFILDNPLLNSGKYENNDFEMKNYGFNLNNYYITDGEYRPFILGSLGYSKYEDNSFDDNTIFAKVGGGIDIVSSPKLSNSFGVAYTRLFTPKVSKATVFHKLNYKSDVSKSIKPYLELTTAYSYIDYSKDNIKEVKGANVELKLGAVKDDTFKLLNVPVKSEWYYQLLLLDNKLKEINDFRSLYTAGVKLNWKVGEKFEAKYLKNLEFKVNIQGTKSDTDFKGYKVGVGISIFKF